MALSLDADDYLRLESRAQRAPSDLALAAPGREPLTYARLWDQLDKTSQALTDCGIGAKEIVALAVPTGPISITAVLGITLRSVCAPLDLSLTMEEQRAYLARLGASTLLYRAGTNPPVVDAAHELGMRLLELRSSTQDPAGVFGIHSLEDPRGNRPARSVDAKLVLHTSATTGAPKLVPRTRASILAAAEQDVLALRLSASDRYLSLIPLNIGHGLTMACSQLLCGASVFCAPGFEAERFARWLDEFRPTWFAAGASVSRMILSVGRQDPRIFSHVPLRFVCSLGAAPEPDLIPALEELVGAPVLENYGMTEASGVTRNTLDGSKAGSVGRTTGGTEIAIFDDAGKQLPAEREGEVGVRGPTLMPGYLDDSQANQEAFRDGWFRTGDIGRIDADGYLFIAGRKKEMIDRGGKKIAPQEIDNALIRHPAVAEVAAFAIPHRTLREDTAAAVVLQPGSEVSELELRRFAATHLAAYKVPRKIVFVAEIPRVTTGKPKRAALTEQFRDLGTPPASAQPDDRPPTETEEKLIAIWRRLLGVERISPGDDFFDLGGDSLTAAHMLTQAAVAFKLGEGKLPEADFFDQATVSALARSIAGRAPKAPSEATLPNRILVLNNGGDRLPIFCFSTAEEDAYQFRLLAQWLGPEQPFTVVCPAHPMQGGRLLTVEEISQQTAATIRAIRPQGPYIMGGHCYGGVVAFEAARQLLAASEPVALLALFDVPTPGYPKIMSAWRAYSRALSDRWSRLAHRAEGQPARPESLHPTLMSQYRPRTLAVPMVHFIGADVHVSTRILSDHRLGWQDFAGAEYQVRRVAGDHVSLFSEANAPALAAEFDGVVTKLSAHQALATTTS